MNQRSRPRLGAASMPLSTVLLAALLALPLPAQQDDAPPPAPPPEARPGWLEGLLYNPAERTEKGATALGAGAPRAAAEALDAAARLEPASDRARYNAGTAHLFASDDAAAPLLESAAQSSDPGVAARAVDNLGNNRLAAPDLEGAIAAYKDSLRRDPASADAKFNLELALRRLQEQQKQNQNQDQQNQNQDQQNQNQDQQKQDQQNQQDQQKQDQQDQQQQDQQNQQQDQQKQDQQNQQDQQKQDQQEDQQNQPGQGQQDPQPPGQKKEESPLPQFRDLPDMDAQQAAAILEAIENLERSQRREEAKKALKANAGGKKDW